MANFIINVDSVSDDAIRTDLEAFIASRPDADKWAQFFQSSSGQLTVEMITALATYLKFDSISARRENYLPYALTRGGIVGGAQQLGYSVNRGRNALFKITFTPATTGTLAKWHILGDVKGAPLVLLNETIVNTGVDVTVDCVIGDIITQDIQSDTAGSSTFRFTNRRVSEDVQVYIDGTVIKHSTEIIDLVDDYFFLQSNAVGSVDAKYLNQGNGAPQYGNGSTITLEYIESKDIVYVLSDLALDITDGVLVSSEVTAIYEAPETDASIKVNAPLQNETKFTIRGRNDFSKLLLLADPDFISAGGRDTAIAAVVEIFALRSDLSVPTVVEKQALLDSIILNRPFGVQPPIIIDASPNFLSVAVSLTLDTTLGDTNALVRGILATYEKRLSTPEEIQQVDFIEIEKAMTESDLVKISRISVSFGTWTASTTYLRGQHVEPIVPNGSIYEMIDVARYSDSVEPTWPAPIPLVLPLVGFTYGQTVQDNEIIWESIAEDNTLDEWTADTVYLVGNRVKHLNNGGNDPEASYRVKEVLSRSATSTPAQFASVVEQGATFTADTIGVVGNAISLVFDGVDDVDTVVGAWNSANPSNTVAFSGVAGATVLTPVTAILIGGEDIFDAEPAWPIPASSTVADERSFNEDNQVLWLMTTLVGTPATWASNTIYKVGDVIIPNVVVGNQSGMMWQMVAHTGRTDVTEPVFTTTFGDTIIDNGLVWVTRDKTASPESPKDNEYYLITESITVV